MWAFKLGGTVPPRPAPVAPPTTIAWSGQVQDTAALSLGVVNNFNIQSAGDGSRGLTNTRSRRRGTRTKAGTLVTWKNTSTRPHTIAARDQSWTTGVIQPGTTGSAIIAKPGTYEYICTDHPWTIGQLIVE